MEKNQNTYEEVNDAWKKTCRILFGKEVGDMKTYAEWLNEYPLPTKTKKSAISGKEIIIGNTEYCDNAKFISFDEIDFNKKYPPLNINEIKDIDSIAQAIQERIYYTGNGILGD